MDKVKIQHLIAERMKQRLDRLGMAENELTNDLDLVRSGLLDSLGFVDLIADLESVSGKQVDLEKALQRSGATTVRAIVELFHS